MKFNLIQTLSVFCLFCINVSNAQVGIGVPAENIHPSAELEVKSTTKGFLPPRMTKAERDAIVTPAAGLLIYQTDGDETNPTGLYFFDGTAWKNGLGLKGETGAVGPKGDTGAQGIQGPAGANGTNGAQGLQGAKGDTGDQGIQGIKGDAGVTGLQGVKGDKGETGSTGPQGIQGLTGPQGDAGVTGSQGVKGDKGDTGSTGPTGSQGIQGVKGDKGDVGATGPQGEPGLTGPQGITGSGSSIVVNNSSSNITNRLCFTNGTSGTAVNSLLTNNALTFNPSTGTLSAPYFIGNVTGNVTGSASSASQVAVTSTTAAFDRYLCFTPNISSGNADLQINSSPSQGLKYNPSTGVLTVPSITLPNGGTLVGDVTGNASSASQVAVASTSSAATRYLSFTPSNNIMSSPASFQTNNALTYVPATGTLSATTFTGNVTGNVAGNVTGNVTGSLVGNATTATTASSASTVATNLAVAQTSLYPTFSSSSISGNASLITDNGLVFNAVTNTLTTTNFIGSLLGNVTGDLTGNVTGTTLKGRNFIQLNPSIVASATPTSDNIVTAGYISATGSITLPTAAAIASSIGGTIGKGTSVEFTVENSSTGDATLVLGTGISVQTSPTIAGTNSLVVSQANAIGRFRLVFTSATTAMLFRVY